MGCLSKSVPVIVILLLTFSNASADSLNLKKPLTLKECIHLALENSSRITIAKRDIVVSELEVKDVRAGYFPKLEASAGYEVNDTYNKIEWTENQYDARLSLTETFYDNGKTSAQTKQAKARLESALLDFQKIQDELTLEVIKNYYELLKAQGMLNVQEEGLKQSQTHLDLARARYDAGVAPKADILKAEVEVSNSELNLIEAENTVFIAQTDLNNIMGIDLDTTLLILETDLTSLTSLTSLTNLTNYALNNRPEIKKAEVSFLVNEIDLKLAKKELLPGITLEGSYNIEVDQLIDKHDWGESTGWEIGIKTSLPIFDAGKSKRGVTKAEINLANTRTNADQLKKEIALEVKKAYLNARSHKKMLETTQKQVTQAKESFDVAGGRYSAGVATMLEVIDAQASLNMANINYIKAIYDYQIAVFSLKKAIGSKGE